MAAARKKPTPSATARKPRGPSAERRAFEEMLAEIDRKIEAQNRKLDALQTRIARS